MGFRIYGLDAILEGRLQSLTWFSLGARITWSIDALPNGVCIDDGFSSRM